MPYSATLSVNVGSLRGSRRRATLTYSEIHHSDSVRGWRIDEIHVPYGFRKCGFGTKLLTRICRKADRDGIRLYLFPQRGDRKGMSNTALRDWYSRHGFRQTPTLSGIWCREPKTPSGSVLPRHTERKSTP